MMKTYMGEGHFDADFQAKIVALILRDPSFLPRYANTIRWEYFDNECCGLVVRVVKEYYEAADGNYQVPIKEVVKALVLDETSRFSGGMDFKQACVGLLDTVYEMSTHGLEQIADKVVEFGRSRTIEALLSQSADMLDKGEDVDRIWELIDRTRSTAAFSTDELDIGSNLVNFHEIIEADSLYNEEHKIPTFILSLDRFMNGGLAKKEVGVVLGYTGTGKSTYLVNMGAAAFLNGHDVIHFSVNELETVDIGARYAARFSGFAADEILTAKKAYSEKMQAILDAVPDTKLFTHYVPPGTSVSTLRSHISRHIYRDGVKPALIVIDNADDLASTRKDRESYVEQGLIYTELKSLAHDFNVALWTDSQTNRTAARSESVSLDMIGNSHKKACKADVIVALAQTREEYNEGLCRLNLVKCRRTGKGSGEVTCSIQSNRMLIQEAAGGLKLVQNETA